MIKSFEQFKNNYITYEIKNNNIVFKNNEGDVGQMTFNVAYVDDILSEYNDSVEDFDESIVKKFNHNKPIVNIEDVWVYKEFRGQNLFRNILDRGLKILTTKYEQFILRACSDNGFPEDKLVDIYRDFGFVTCQETEYDGTIMVLIYKK
jgi:hypothetical protein